MSTYPKVVPQDLEDEVVAEQYTRIPNTNVTICTLTLKNTRTCVGVNYGSVDARNYDEKLGRSYARKDAIEQMWPLLGFRLADKLAMINASGKPTGKITELGDARTALGTKVIHFVAMNRADYNTYRGWDLPANENGDDNGYLVEYADGGSPNVPGHSGYVSWSPADVFERAYDFVVRH